MRRGYFTIYISRLCFFLHAHFRPMAESLFSADGRWPTCIGNFVVRFVRPQLPVQSGQISKLSDYFDLSDSLFSFISKLVWSVLVWGGKYTKHRFNSFRKKQCCMSLIHARAFAFQCFLRPYIDICRAIIVSTSDKACHSSPTATGQFIIFLKGQLPWFLNFRTTFLALAAAGNAEVSYISRFSRHSCCIAGFGTNRTHSWYCKSHQAVPSLQRLYRLIRGWSDW